MSEVVVVISLLECYFGRFSRNSTIPWNVIPNAPAAQPVKGPGKPQTVQTNQPARIDVLADNVHDRDGRSTQQYQRQQRHPANFDEYPRMS